MSEIIRPFYTSGSASTIEISDDKCMLTKKCSIDNQGIENGHDKLFYEALEIRNSPTPHFYPIIHDIKYVEGLLHVRMEYLFNGVTLADLLRNPLVSQAYINNSLYLILDSLLSEFYLPEQGSLREDYIKHCYLDRVLRRLEDSLKYVARGNGWDTYQKAVFNGMVLNGQFYPSVFQYLHLLYQDQLLLQRLSVSRIYNSHHDLIPGNILVNISKDNDRIEEFRLIDPRGRLETGVDIRHPMYDFGKLFFGLDCYDLFRSSAREDFRENYVMNITHGQIIDEYNLIFFLDDPVIKHYVDTQTTFLNYCHNLFQTESQTESQIQDKILQLYFSFACMYHPDIPCRQIDEGSEHMALNFYLRGMMALRQFMDHAYGLDPLRKNGEYDDLLMWPGDGFYIKR